MRLKSRLTAALRAQEGFTMLIALGVMLVSSLLMVAAFEAANGDIHLSHKSDIQKQAYYAALAGIQEYEYHLQENPNYWETCAAPSSTVPQEPYEHYEIKLLPASTAPLGTKACNTANPFGTMIQSTGPLANTFRVESLGTAGKVGTTAYESRSLVATFHVVGFLNFIYFTQYEVEDPALYGGPKECANYYAKRQELGLECQTIVFANNDTVAGPMHSDDAVDVCGKANFGRIGHNPPDEVQINGGVYGTCGPPEPTFYTANGKSSVGLELLTPEGDTSLGTYVKEGGYEFSGVTHIVLNGGENTMTVTKSTGVKETLKWPENGLVYVRANKESACAYSFSPTVADNAAEVATETNCGNVYVSGTYSNSLTVGAEGDVIVNGNIYPTSVAGKLGSEASGTDTLGLIAGSYVRVYHPLTGPNGGKCGGSENAEGSLPELWIYAGILSTNHSFTVDNYNCGANLGKLHVYGAIAQRFRGIVGLTSGPGYIKDYKYDERLAVDEPPYFLNPLNAGWEVERVTSPTAG
jgi:hypothetical protein